MDESRGTRTLIAECHRLLDRCVAEAPKGDPEEVGAAMDVVFDLLRHIDEGEDDVLFFADDR